MLLFYSSHNLNYVFVWLVLMLRTDVICNNAIILKYHLRLLCQNELYYNSTFCKQAHLLGLHDYSGNMANPIQA